MTDEPGTVAIRTLGAGDAAEYFEVRLRALREHPDAFATSYEEDRQRSLDEVARSIALGPERVTLGAFQAGRLVGIATVVRAARSKLQHRATVAGMYVAPEARGSGLGRELLRRLVDVTRRWEGVTDLSLAVTVGNAAARSLYASEGFVCYAVDKRGLRVDGRFLDVEWMALPLEEGARARSDV